MNFLTMNYFIALAQERSFTQAAEKLHITQQTLSAHIAGVERELGCRLVTRHVPLELTYAGQVFLRYALDFRCRLGDLEQEFHDIRRDEKGLVRIGIASTRGRAIMPFLISAFQKSRPQIDIQLAEAANDALIQSLTAGEIDLAVAHFSEAVPGMELQDFYEEEIVLLVSRKLVPEALGADGIPGLSALGKCPFLLNGPRDIAGRIGRRLLDQAGIAPPEKVSSTNVETLLDLCVRGAGACFCPENLAQAALSEEQLSGLRTLRFGQEARYMIRFGYRRQRYPWSIIAEFIQLSRQLMSRPDEIRRMP